VLASAADRDAARVRQFVIFRLDTVTEQNISIY